MCFILAHNNTIFAQNLSYPKMKMSVTLTPKTSLGKALKKAGIDDPTAVTSLAITGTITKDVFRNTDDLHYIRKNMRVTLQELDLSEALLPPRNIFFAEFGKMRFIMYICAL